MSYTDDDINWVYDRAGGQCFYRDMRLSFKNYGIVGAKGAWEIDHFLPVRSGGAHQPYNWVPACVDCNTRKSDSFPWEFDPDRFRVRDRNPDNYIRG
jgi:5-methylcytosine-specific restriction endonuclease McrA